MKKVLGMFFIAVMVSCGGNDLVGEYHCEMPDGKFGSVLRFKKGGKLFLDLVPQELVERNPDLGRKLNVPGEYEIIDDQIVIKYFNGAQSHTLTKIGDKLTSATNTFRLCTCTSK